MELPLVTLLGRLGMDNLPEPCTISIHGIRLYTGQMLEGGILYLCDRLPEQSGFEEGTAAIVIGKPAPTPYVSVFVERGDMGILFNRIVDIFDEFAGYHAQIQKMIYQGGGLKALILLYSKILGNPAYIVDSSFKILAIDDSPMLSEISAIWKHSVEHGYLSYAIVAGLRKSDELKRMESHNRAVLMDSQYFNNAFISYTLREDGVVKGHFFVVGLYKKITPGDVAYADYLGRMALLAMEQDGQYATSRGKDYENFFIHMLSGALKDPVQIQQQLAELGWDVQGRYLVCKLLPKERDELLLELLCCKIDKMKSGKPLHYDGGIVAVFPLTAPDQGQAIAREFRAILQEDGGIGSLSDECNGFHQLSAQYRQVCAALDLGIWQPGELVTYSQCVFFHLLHSAQGAVDFPMLCEPGVFQLWDYDAKHGTDYVPTLTLYIKNERSIALSAKALQIHRNTLIYRVNRLKQILHLDLDDPAVRQRLLLSFWVLQYLEKFPLESPLVAGESAGKV